MFNLIVDANMKVTSSGGVGLVLVLDGCWPRPTLFLGRDVFSCMWQGGAFTNLSRDKRGEI